MNMRGVLRRVRLLLLAAPCAAALAGCAYSYIDGDGNRNVVGLVHLTLPPSAPAPKAADWMRVRTVGLALSRTDIGGALELGYADSTLAAVRNNSCVQIDQLPSVLIATSGDHNVPVSASR